jgi:hypothetical protein
MVYAGDPVLASDISALEDVAWTDFTPTFTNITVGNGTLSCAYLQIGRFVTARYSLVLGSTSSVGSAGNATLPVPIASNTQIGGKAWYRDSSATSNYQGLVALSGSVMVFLRLVEAQTGISATSPFTWASSDEIKAMISYEAT